MRLIRGVAVWRGRRSGRRTAGRTLEVPLGCGGRRDGIIPRRCGARHQVSGPGGLDSGAAVQELMEGGRHCGSELTVVCLAFAAGAAFSLQGPCQAHGVVAGLGHTLDDLAACPAHHGCQTGRPGVLVAFLQHGVGLVIVRGLGRSLGGAGGAGGGLLLVGRCDVAPPVVGVGSTEGVHCEFLQELVVVWNCGPGSRRGGSHGSVDPVEELLLSGEEERDDCGHGHADFHGAIAILRDGSASNHDEVVCGYGHSVVSPNHAVQEDGPPDQLFHGLVRVGGEAHV